MAQPTASGLAEIEGRYVEKESFIAYLRRTAEPGAYYDIKSYGVFLDERDEGQWSTETDHIHHFVPVRVGTNSHGEPIQIMRCECGLPLTDHIESLRNDW